MYARVLSTGILTPVRPWVYGRTLFMVGDVVVMSEDFGILMDVIFLS